MTASAADRTSVDTARNALRYYIADVQFSHPVEEVSGGITLNRSEVNARVYNSGYDASKVGVWVPAGQGYPAGKRLCFGKVVYRLPSKETSKASDVCAVITPETPTPAVQQRPPEPTQAPNQPQVSEPAVNKVPRCTVVSRGSASSSLNLVVYKAGYLSIRFYLDCKLGALPPSSEFQLVSPDRTVSARGVQKDATGYIIALGFSVPRLPKTYSICFPPLELEPPSGGKFYQQLECEKFSSEKANKSNSKK
jgi:hypothetical protein